MNFYTKLSRIGFPIAVLTTMGMLFHLQQREMKNFERYRRTMEIAHNALDENKALEENLKNLEAKCK